MNDNLSSMITPLIKLIKLTPLIKLINTLKANIHNLELQNIC